MKRSRDDREEDNGLQNDEEERNSKTIVKEKVNFGLTGALAKDEETGNMRNGVLLKYSPPLDAAVPDKLWRLYVFKEDSIVETLHIHRQDNYLIGKDERVSDIVLAHPSISKQHCVIQFRKVQEPLPYVKKPKAGEFSIEEPELYRTVIKPYIIDLESSNKTYLNCKREDANSEPIEDSRFYELREKDMLMFGYSTREYVLICADKEN